MNDINHSSDKLLEFQPYLGFTVVELTSVVITVVVTLSNGGRAVGGGTGADPDIRITKLPIPIQKAMARPVTKPTTAP